MPNKPLKLRPHHGMCLAYFIGEGYSNAFTAHMRQILESTVPDTPVVLTVGTDTICGACPNHDGGVCTADGKVSRYDQAVLDLCGLCAGTSLSFSAFTELVQDRILMPGLRSAVCGDCQWDSICASQPSRWEKSENSAQ